MNFFSRKTSETPTPLNEMRGFTPDLYREACKLALELQEGGALSMTRDNAHKSKNFPDLVEALSGAKIRMRAKRITSEVPKFD